MSTLDGSRFDGWFAPVPRSHQTATRSALVIVVDVRTAIATTLILQEMGLSVDFGHESTYALQWLKQTRYDLIVTSGPGIGTVEYAAQIRAAASSSRIVILGENDITVGDANRLEVDVLEAPVNVNQLVGWIVAETE